jgi:hypothetical protein
VSEEHGLKRTNEIIVPLAFHLRFGYEYDIRAQGFQCFAVFAHEDTYLVEETISETEPDGKFRDEMITKLFQKVLDKRPIMGYNISTE